MTFNVFFSFLIFIVGQNQDGEATAKAQAQSTDADAAGKYMQKPDVMIKQPYCGM